MKTILAVLTLAFLTTGALAWGASNPSAVDHPDVPNCTILDPVPGCETVIPQGAKSIYDGIRYTPSAP